MERRGTESGREGNVGEKREEGRKWTGEYIPKIKINNIVSNKSRV